VSDKLMFLWPEIVLFAFTCVVLIVGLSGRAALRSLCAPLCAVALIIAGLLAWQSPIGPDPLGHLAGFGKLIAAGVGLLILLLLSGSADRDYEASVARGQPYQALRTTRAEFYALFLFSITGLMLCAGATDLIWLFLALELTSLPTYVMVAISTKRNRSMEAGVKYFFLGALGAAFFLYGFTLVYGATGSTSLTTIHTLLSTAGANGALPELNPILITGLLLSILGIGFKIAAVPLHFYTPDVYQGSSASMAAMLAFVPKAAGFFALIVLLAAVGWRVSPQTGLLSLPSPLTEVLWIMAVLTMTVGNVLALRQRSVKRLLAYSSISHSGYMLVGIIAGPGLIVAGVDPSFATNGIAAVLFYLMAYGVMNLGAFAVLACLNTTAPDGQTEEVDDISQLRGLCTTRPLLGWTMVICSMSLLGLPPLLGFFGKLPLFSAGLASGHTVLVIILGINSAIAACYYLRLASTVLLESPDLAGAQANVRPNPIASRSLAGLLSAVGAIALAAYPLTGLANQAGRYRSVAALNAQPKPFAKLEPIDPAAEPNAGAQSITAPAATGTPGTAKPMSLDPGGASATKPR
jgi:NADH-quinone oxidoreductase subunit N